ncbi:MULTISPECIES: hypothetical protein [unclassified Nocardioides]|uniref:hypothetical protein n=1 Tax=unclassified Nocardioides TaxID=2615069 RepID=UPI0030145A0F
MSASDDHPADLVAHAVLAVPGVLDLHGGAPGEVATYLPGRRVRGVRLLEPGCEVHVVLDWTAPLGDTTDRIRAALRPIVDAPVHVFVEDVAVSEGQHP